MAAAGHTGHLSVFGVGIAAPDISAIGCAADAVSHLIKAAAVTILPDKGSGLVIQLHQPEVGVSMATRYVSIVAHRQAADHDAAIRTFYDAPALVLVVTTQ